MKFVLVIFILINIFVVNINGDEDILQFENFATVLYKASENSLEFQSYLRSHMETLKSKFVTNADLASMSSTISAKDAKAYNKAIVAQYVKTNRILKLSEKLNSDDCNKESFANRNNNLIESALAVNPCDLKVNFLDTLGIPVDLLETINQLIIDTEEEPETPDEKFDDILENYELTGLKEAIRKAIKSDMLVGSSLSETELKDKYYKIVDELCAEESYGYSGYEERVLVPSCTRAQIRSLKNMVVNEITKISVNKIPYSLSSKGEFTSYTYEEIEAKRNIIANILEKHMYEAAAALYLKNKLEEEYRFSRSDENLKLLNDQRDRVDALYTNYVANYHAYTSESDISFYLLSGKLKIDLNERKGLDGLRAGGGWSSYDDDNRAGFIGSTTPCISRSPIGGGQSENSYINLIAASDTIASKINFCENGNDSDPKLIKDIKCTKNCQRKLEDDKRFIENSLISYGDKFRGVVHVYPDRARKNKIADMLQHSPEGLATALINKGFNDSILNNICEANEVINNREQRQTNINRGIEGLSILYDVASAGLAVFYGSGFLMQGGKLAVKSATKRSILKQGGRTFFGKLSGKAAALNRIRSNSQYNQILKKAYTTNIQLNTVSAIEAAIFDIHQNQILNNKLLLSNSKEDSLAIYNAQKEIDSLVNNAVNVAIGAKPIGFRELKVRSLKRIISANIMKKIPSKKILNLNTRLYDVNYILKTINYSTELTTMLNDNLGLSDALFRNGADDISPEIISLLSQSNEEMQVITETLNSKDWSELIVEYNNHKNNSITPVSAEEDAFTDFLKNHSDLRYKELYNNLSEVKEQSQELAKLKLLCFRDEDSCRVEETQQIVNKINRLLLLKLPGEADVLEAFE